MSIYVKNVKVPECCAECPFETLFSNDIHYCTAKEIPEEIPTAYYWECRPSFCPMSEVPEHHGDLTDIVSRADAIEALGEEPEIWTDTDEEWAYHNAWVEHISALKALPSVGTKLTQAEKCEDCIHNGTNKDKITCKDCVSSEDESMSYMIKNDNNK